jgi:hypothetical protein
MEPESVYELSRRVNWLKWEIDQRKRDIDDYTKRGKVNGVKIATHEMTNFQIELDWRQGRIEKPVSKYDNMSKDMLDLHDQLINKQIVLVANKSTSLKEKIINEIRLIEIQIEKQKRLEGKLKEIQPVPF